MQEPNKVLTAAQIKAWDQFTIVNEPILSIDLMERASKKCVDCILNSLHFRGPFTILSGTGNNGGDGLAIARLLHTKGVELDVFIVGDANTGSEDFKINLNRCEAANINIQKYNQNTNTKFKGTIIDAIFGTGLSRVPEGIHGQAIEAINASDSIVVSIDVPSGLYADVHTPNHQMVVNANYTLTFEVLKFAFLFAENHNRLGHVQVIPIGLLNSYKPEGKIHGLLLNKDITRSKVKASNQFDHKGKNGHALLIAGSKNKMGAAVLSVSAALRSGVGLLTVHTVESGTEPLNTACPEAMLSIDENEFFVSHLPELNVFSSIGIGPGIGSNKHTSKLLLTLMSNFKGTVVLDADALNIVSENEECKSLLNSNCILTPHVKEFDRLAGNSSNDFERHEKQLEFAKKHNCYVLLKGAYSKITTPEGEVFINQTGNPGMAKGGSGDVLTGIITGLCAQGYSTLDALTLGVYWHGLAGDLAAQTYTAIAMKSGDIVEMMPNAIKAIMA
ncbi:MAG TPA: NAD(P)H-hydrate dehydratase [Bacteroidia bacterium]